MKPCPCSFLVKQKIKSYFLTAHCAACWKSTGFRHIKENVLIGFCPSLFFIKIRTNRFWVEFIIFFSATRAKEATRIPSGTNPCLRHSQSKLCLYSAIPSDIPALISFVSIITVSILSSAKRKPSRETAWERHHYHLRHLHNSTWTIKPAAENSTIPFLPGWNELGIFFIFYFLFWWRKTLLIFPAISLQCPPFLSPGGTTRAVLVSGSQGCLGKCWVMELKNSGCSPRKGNLECLSCHKTSQGSKEEFEPQG